MSAGVDGMSAGVYVERLGLRLGLGLRLRLGLGLRLRVGRRLGLRLGRRLGLGRRSYEK
jgi:hypothetical protein